MRITLSIIFVLLFSYSQAQVNAELAPSPPMGWNSWNWFGKDAINEKIIKEVIDAIASNGIKEVGYEYVVIDGGWRDTTLGPNGELLVNRVKFPSGMKALADYAHSKGLKFGLHTVPGSHDCGCDKVGGWGVEEVQVKQFVEWGVDFIKLDMCRFSLDENPQYPRNDPRWKKGWKPETGNLIKAYSKWSRLLRESGRDVILSASAYRYYDWYPKLTNMGRTTGDIRSKQSNGAIFDSERPGSVMSIAVKNNRHYQHAGRGYWNDPDMLVTGDQGLTQEEQKAHFALWCIMTSPLILGNDPRQTSEDEKKIILNKTAIAVNQDPTEQGRRIKVMDKSEIWAKKLKNGDVAVLLLNRDKSADKEITLKFSDIGLSGNKIIEEVYEGLEFGKFKDSFTKNIPSRSGLFLLIKSK